MLLVYTFFMQRKQIAIVFLAIFVLSIVGYFVYTSIIAVYFVRSENRELTAIEIEENKSRIHSVLIDIPHISERDLLNGFWYVYTDEYGNEHVLYFDPEYLARKGLSDEEIKMLYDRLVQSEVSPPESMKLVAESDLPPELQFHNKVYSFGVEGKTEDMLTSLELLLESGEYTAEDLFKLAYLYELEGRYNERDSIYAKSCLEFGTKCTSEDVLVTIQGEVLDTAGNPIADAVVGVLSKDGITPVTTDSEGNYKIIVPVRELQKVRLRALKEHYSDGITDFIVITDKRKNYTVDDIIIEEAVIVVYVNTNTKTVTGAGGARRQGDDFFITTTEGQWKIPFDSIIRKTGDIYSGDLTVYVYEWIGDSAPSSLLQLDVFGGGQGFVSDAFLSFGMPYIQFVATDGEELHVESANPMELTHRMAILSPEHRTIAERPLTDTDMQLLLDASKKAGYPVTYDLLQNLGMVYVPPFWVLDRIRGVWDNVGFKVINKDGLVKVPFYTMKTF